MSAAAAPAPETKTDAPAAAAAAAAPATAAAAGAAAAAPTAGTRVALVTGANKGIGLATVKSLATKPKLTVLLGARSRAAGEEAVRGLALANVKLIVIDVDDAKSITAAAEEVKREYGGLDILINNAGIAFKGSRFDDEVVRVTFATNYYGLKAVCEAFFPLLRPNARVVNVSSMISRSTLNKLKPEVANAFLAADSTVASIEALLNKFVSDVHENKHKAEGWPESAYGMSKVGVSALTRIQAREMKTPGVVVSAVCPGYVATDMSSFKGTKTVEQGAETPVYAALLPDGAPTGLFYENSAVAVYK